MFVNFVCGAMWASQFESQKKQRFKVPKEFKLPVLAPLARLAPAAPPLQVCSGGFVGYGRNAGKFGHLWCPKRCSEFETVRLSESQMETESETFRLVCIDSATSVISIFELSKVPKPSEPPTVKPKHFVGVSWSQKTQRLRLIHL